MTLMQWHLSLGLLLLALSASAHSACDALVEKVTEPLTRGSANPDPPFTFAVCKPFPGDADRSIVVVAKFRGDRDSVELAPSFGAYDLHVMIVRSADAEVLHRFTKKEAIPVDAVMLTGIDIDAAPYMVAPGARAFGMRAMFAHNGGTNLRFETLHLYRPHSGAIQELLSGLTTSVRRTEAMFDCWNASSAQRTISIARRHRHDFADLVVRERSSKREVKLVGTRCTEIEKRATRTYVLQYDGTVYDVPKALRFY